jgi:hypothetical protein
MSDIDMESAVAALSSELPDENGGFVASESEESFVEDNQVEPESFTGFDPTILPEDMQQVYKSMQADYTRKTQEIAELRRNYESFSEQGIDPTEALEAVSLLQRMNNDPEFAGEVATGIQARLEELGYSAQQAVNDTPIVDNNSYDGLPVELQQELLEMRQFRQEMMESQEQQSILMELEASENTIRTMNPDYTDDDMEAIYSLAYATDGDLMLAQQQYHTIQQRLLGSYLQAKSVPHGATPAPNSPSSVPNREFSNLDEAHKAAMEAIRNIS